VPMQPTRFCSCRPDCPNRIEKGVRFCKDGQALKDRQRPNANLRRFYFTERWARTRRRQLDKEPACYDCADKGKLEPATDVHHKRKPLTEIDFFDERWLGSLCHRCHSIRTQRGE
jgi:5-methylcytosine-specific restriction enzyme A